MISVKMVDYRVASNGNEATTFTSTNEVSIFTSFFTRMPS